MKYKYLLLLPLLVTLDYSFTIEEAVKIGLENSLKIKEKEEYVRGAEFDLKGANAALKLPKIWGEYNYERHDYDSPESVYEFSSGGVKTSYNLFNGFYDEYYVLSKEKTLKQKEYELRATQNDQKLQIKKAYISYLLAKDILKVKKYSLNVFEQNYNDALNFYEQGLIAKNELLQVAVEKSKALDAYEGAKKGIKIAYYVVKNEIGVEDFAGGVGDFAEGQIEEVAVDLEKLNLDFETLKPKALENRSEIKALKESLHSLENEARANENYKYPKITAEVGVLGVGDTPYADGRDNLYDNDIYGKVNLSYTFYDGDKSSSQKESILAKKQALWHKIKDTQNTVSLQLQEAILDFEQAKKEYKSAKLSLEYADENYRIVKKRFDAQIDKASDLLNGAFLLTRAKNDLAVAYFGAIVKFFEIERITEEVMAQ